MKCVISCTKLQEEERKKEQEKKEQIREKRNIINQIPRNHKEDS